MAEEMCQQLYQLFAANFSAIVTVFATIITAVATVVLARLTARYVYLTNEIVEGQVRPNVHVTLVHERNRPSVIQLVIKNTGHGIATNIRFVLSRSIPERGWGMEVENAPKSAEMKSGPLINGIPALGPEEERRIDWGQYGGLKKNLGDEAVRVTCLYSDGKKELSNVCFLDIRSFEGTQANRGELRQIADDLSKIRETLGHFATGFRKLGIIIADPPVKPTKEELENLNDVNENG